MIIFRGQDIRFCLDIPLGQLWRGRERSGEPIHLPPKQWELLRYLAQNPTRLVSKEELVAKIWGLNGVTDDAISRAVSRVRRALGDDPDRPLFIQTVHGRGFRFVAEIENGVEQSSPRDDSLQPQLTRDSSPSVDVTGAFRLEVEFRLRWIQKGIGRYPVGLCAAVEGGDVAPTLDPTYTRWSLAGLISRGWNTSKLRDVEPFIEKFKMTERECGDEARVQQAFDALNVVVETLGLAASVW